MVRVRGRTSTGTGKAQDCHWDRVTLCSAFSQLVTVTLWDLKMVVAVIPMMTLF